jgi:hypothetical protein
MTSAAPLDRATRTETCVLPPTRTEEEATMSNEIETTSVSETEKTEREAKTDAAVEQVIDSALGLGKLWARHGLTIGKLALETSAQSLGTTARLLSSLADAIAPEAKPASEDDAKAA